MICPAAFVVGVVVGLLIAGVLLIIPLGVALWDEIQGRR